jgi:hypothetical protein
LRNPRWQFSRRKTKYLKIEQARKCWKTNGKKVEVEHEMRSENQTFIYVQRRSFPEG